MNIDFGKLFGVLALASVTILAACGGGGSSGSVTPAAVITGTAAAGAPIVGAVMAKDSKGNSFGPATIGTDGKYSLTVTGGAAPFVMQASGVVGTVTVDVYSVANDTAAINLNINPMTNMVVAQATGSSPAAVFANCSSATCTTPVKAKVDLGQQQVQALLLDLLAKFGISGTINLLTDAMVAGPVANQSPLDKMLDVVSIQPASAGSASFEIKPNPVSGLSTTTVLVTVPAPPAGGVTTVTATPLPVDPSLTTTVVTAATNALTSLQAIQSQFDALTSLFATTKPSASDPALLALFDASFSNWGITSTGFINKITGTNGVAPGATYTGVVAAAPRPAASASIQGPATLIANDATHQWFTFVFTAPGQVSQTNGPWLAIKDASSGKWLIAGSQMPTPSFAGSYSSTSVLSGYTHTENDTVSSLAVSGNHTFTNGTSSGSFVWTGNIAISATDNRSGTISGTVTINNLGTRTATLTGGVYVKNDGSAQMWWTATDPTYGGIGWCTTTTGASCPSSSAAPAPAPTSSIVGTWTMPLGSDGVTPTFTSLVLLADGRYMLLIDNESTLNGSSVCKSMESGTYTYDATAQQLTLTVIYDSSSTCGLYNGNTALPATLIVPFTTAGKLTPPGTTTQFSFTKLATGTTAVGTWLVADTGSDFNVMINYADGRFMYGIANLGAPSTGVLGLESGTYTATSTTYTVNSITYDGNGINGMSNALNLAMSVTPNPDANHVLLNGSTAMVRQ